MSSSWVHLIAESKDVALVLSLSFNVAACGAIWRLYRSRERLQDRVTQMLTELVRELTRMNFTGGGK